MVELLGRGREVERGGGREREGVMYHMRSQPAL